MASPDSLDSALCEAVRRGWWWGASKLVAAGARAHAAYETTVSHGKHGEVTITRCVYMWMYIQYVQYVCHIPDDIVARLILFVGLSLQIGAAVTITNNCWLWY